MKGRVTRLEHTDTKEERVGVACMLPKCRLCSLAPPFPTLPYPTYPTLSYVYPILPYPTLPYPVLPYSTP